MNEQELIDQDLFMFRAEQEYERQRPRLSEVEWLSVFPEARPQWGKVVKLSLKIVILKNRIEIGLIKWEIGYRLKMLYAGKTQEEIDSVVWIGKDIQEHGNGQIAECEKNIRAAEYRIEYLNNMGKEQVTAGNLVTAEMVRRAREYPIDKLVEVNRAGFTRCWNHTDENASMYTKNGFCFCFTCNYSADSIKILIDREKLTFQEAVKKLQ